MDRRGGIIEVVPASKTPDAPAMAAGRAPTNLAGRASTVPRLPNSLLNWLRARATRPMVVATGYLAWLTVAEIVSAVSEPRVGLLLHALLLVALLYHSSRSLDDPLHKLMLALAFAPLIRLLSYAMPLAALPKIYWYAATSLPLFAAAAVTAPSLGYSRRALGLQIGQVPVQLLVALSGFVFGYIEYQILAPAPLAAALTWKDILLPAVILLWGTGFFEELLFRGILQCAAVETLGRYGVAFGAVVFAVLHIGYKSLVDVVFVMAVGFFFGWIVARTRSLLGVTLAHGLTNIMLFLVMPFVAVTAPAPVLTRPPGAPVATAAGPAVTQASVTPPRATPTPAPGGPGAAGSGTATVASTPGPAATPSPAPYPSSTPEPAPGAAWGTVNADAAMLRKGPGTTYPVLGLVFEGSSYAILGRNPAGDWWFISVDAQTSGWVYGPLLTTRGDLLQVATVVP